MSQNKRSKSKSGKSKEQGRERKNEDDDVHEMVEMIDDFAQIISADEFTKKCQSNVGLQEKMKGLQFIFNNLCKAAGVTEYSSIDGGYRGDEILDKYKQNMVASWGDKQESDLKTKKITKDEMDDGAQGFATRRRALAEKREQRRLLLGQQPRKLIMADGKVDGQSKYGDYVEYVKQSSAIESASSDDDEDAILDKILGGSSLASHTSHHQSSGYMLTNDSDDELQNYNMSTLAESDDST